MTGEWHAVPCTRPEQKPPTELEKQGAFTSIVREPTQNSTDNRLDETRPVKVKFSLKSIPLGTVKDSYLPQDIWMNHVSSSAFYRGSANRRAEPHAQAAGTEWDNDEDVQVLLIEDYNTTGLAGDVTLYQHDPDDTPADERRNTFYWLLRTIGMTSPSTGRGGSWGLGKLAFPLASRLKTFFVVTSRDDGGERFLLGQALLEYRKDRFDDNMKYDNMLYFANQFDNDVEDHWIPISDQDEINEFCTKFDVDRPLDKPGTSFIIPYPRNTDDDPVNDLHRLMCGVSLNYALGIMQGRLELEFVDANGTTTTINAENFRELIEQDNFRWEAIQERRRGQPTASYTTKERVLELLDLFEKMSDDDAGNQEDCEEFELPPLEGGRRLYERFDEVMPEQGTDDFERLKDAFQDGKFIKIKHSVPVVNADNSMEDGVVEFVVHNVATNDERAQAHYYRSQISLPMVNRKEPLRPSLSSLVMVGREDADALSEMLRSAEGPAHLNWETQGDRLEAYRLGPATIRYIKNLPELLVSRLLSVEGEANPLWQDLFSFGGDERDDDNEGEGEGQEVDGIERLFTITDLPDDTGFSVEKRATADSLEGESFLLQIGYPNPPLLKWNRAPDSRLSDATEDITGWQSQGCTVETIQHDTSGNTYTDKVRLTVVDNDFKLIVNSLRPEKKARMKLQAYEGNAEVPGDGFTLNEVELNQIEEGA